MNIKNTLDLINSWKLIPTNMIMSQGTYDDLRIWHVDTQKSLYYWSRVLDVSLEELIQLSYKTTGTLDKLIKITYKDKLMSPEVMARVLGGQEW